MVWNECCWKYEQRISDKEYYIMASVMVSIITDGRLIYEPSLEAVCNQWTGSLDWITGLAQFCISYISTPLVLKFSNKLNGLICNDTRIYSHSYYLCMQASYIVIVDVLFIHMHLVMAFYYQNCVCLNPMLEIQM